MKKSILLIMLLLSVACEDSSNQNVTSKLEDSFSTKNSPEDIIDNSNVTITSYEDYHKIEETNINRKLDILVVPDTSGSIKEERSQIAKGFHHFLNSLPDEIDYNIGVLLAHGPKSNIVGKLFRKNNEPYVLKSKELTIDQIKEYLDLKIHKPKEDGSSDGGEMGMYAILEAIKAEKLTLIKEQGLFREGAALAVVFIADEQDICAKFPDGVTPVEDKQNAERKMFVDYCIEEDIKWKDVKIGSSEYTYKITPEMVVEKLKLAYPGKRLVVGGVIYNESSILPTGDEDEIGYGYREIISLTNGVSIDLASGDYGEGLSKIGRLAAVSEGEISNTFNLKSEFTDKDSIKVYLDGQEYHDWVFNINDQTITLNEERDLLSLVKIGYTSDAASPVITLSSILPTTTNIGQLDLSFLIDEDYLDTVKIYNNDLLIDEQNSNSALLQLNLVEGENIIKIIASDKSGHSSTYIAETIILDTTPPELVMSYPAQGEVLKQLNFSLEITFNEEIATLEIDGLKVFENESHITFEKDINLLSEGTHSIELSFWDKSGNKSQYTISYEVSLKIFQEDLIAIQEAPTGLQIIGSAGAVTPGLEIELKTGLFEKIIVISAPDGSFIADVPPFDDIDIFAHDPTIDRDETITLVNNIDNSLTGIVKDSDGSPLPSVTVSIQSSNQLALTDASGVFKIQSPAVGIQKIIIDGTTSPMHSSEKRYSKTAISFNIAAFSKNVIENVIYLTALDVSNATIVESSTEAIITNPNLENVELRVPAGVAQFPDGSNSGYISIEKISSDRSSLPPPNFAIPSHVYALEPSGTVFSEPIDLTIPNDNNFPAGLDIVILSKDSLSGEWVIDAAAKVDSSGSTITTLPGQGLTHFSDIFAVPIFPLPKNFDKSVIGADSFKNSLSRSVSLPKYKALNSQFGIDLYYNSQYAFPSPVITNALKIPETKIERDLTTQEIKETDYTATIENEIYKELKPVSIEGKLTVANIDTGWFEFSGEIKEDTVVSYGVDLSSLETGIYPYTAAYKIKFQNLIIATQNVEIKQPYKSCVWKWVGYVCKKKYQTSNLEPKTQEKKLLKSIFPDDLIGQISVVNKKHSSIGRGWSVSGLQNIVDPLASQFVIDEGDSKLSVFNPEITAEVIKEGDYKALSISNGSLYLSQNNGDLFEINNFETNDLSLLKAGSQINNTKYTNIMTTQLVPDPNCGGPRCNWIPQTSCQKVKSTFTLFSNINSILPLEGGKFYFVDGQNSFKSIDNNGVNELVSSGLKPLQNSVEFGYLEGTFCNQDQDIFSNCQDEILEEHSGACNEVYAGNSSGYEPVLGYRDGSFSEALFNRPKSISYGIGNKFVVADYGNNRIREVDVSNGYVSTIVGNGNTSTLILEGRTANSISLAKPIDAKYDSKGNLYILTEVGWLVRINNSNIVEIIVAANNNGIKSSYNLRETFLKNPSNFIIDDPNQNIYISDTGNHRVLKLDLNRNLTTTIAGNGVCQIGSPVKNIVNSLEANLCYPTALAITSSGNIYVQDSGHQVLRKLNFTAESANKLTFLAASNNGEKIIKNEDDTFDRVKPDGSYIKFSPLGKQIESVSKRGLKTIFTYENNLLSVITDPLGNDTTFHYLNGRIDKISDHTGRDTSFTHNSNGDIENISFPNTFSKSFFYHPNGLLFGETNQNGYLTQYKYTAHNKLNEIILPDDSKRIFKFGIEDTVLDASKNSEEQFLSSIIEANIFDEYIDGNNNSVAVLDDRENNRKVFQDPEGKNTTIQYNDLGQAKIVTKPDSSYIEFFYNNKGEIVKKYDSSKDANEIFDFNDQGKLIRHTNLLGQTRTITYNLFGDKIQEVSFSGKTQNWVYSDEGLLEKTYFSDPEVATVFTYNELGLLSERKFPDGQKITYIHDDAGNVIEQFSDPNAKTIMTYNDFNQITSVAEGVSSTDPLGTVTTYLYTKTGKLEAVVDPRGNQILYSYDKLDRQVSLTNPLGDTSFVGFDGNGNVNYEKDFNGNEKVHYFDSLNRKYKTELPDDVYYMSFNSDGNLETISNDLSTIEYSYVQRNGEYVISQEKTNVEGHSEAVVNFNILSNGVLDNIATSWGTISYNYNSDLEITSFTDMVGDSYVVGRDSEGLLKSLTNNHGIKTEYSYTDNRQVSSVLNKYGSSTLSSFGYAYNNQGLIEIATSSKGTKTYGYDSELQLRATTDTEISETTPEFFNYDELGNRTSSNDGNYEYNDTKTRIVRDWKYSYIHDKNGNLTSKFETQNMGNVINYTHNSLNQLIDVKEYENSVLVKQVVLKYDALGRRVGKEVIDHQNTSNSIEERYGYIGRDVVAIMDSTNDVLARITHSNLRSDEAIAVHVTAKGQGKIASNSGSYFYLRDMLGTVVDIANSSGSLVQHYVYNSFGKILDIKDGSNSSIIANPVVKTLYAFANSFYDKELGLYFNNLRYYDASTGRFIESDPHPGYITLPKTMINKFIYSANNPINFRDPSGANILEDFVNGLANTIAGAINGIGKYVESFFQDLGELLTSEEFRVILIVGAALATGGLAAGAGGFAGAFVGSIVGGITGAAVGGIHAQLSGDDMGEWMQKGFQIGAVVGGISGYTKGFGLFENGGSEFITDAVSTSQAQAVNTSVTNLTQWTWRCAIGLGVGIGGSVIAGIVSSSASPLVGVGVTFAGLWLTSKVLTAAKCI